MADYVIYGTILNADSVIVIVIGAVRIAMGWANEDQRMSIAGYRQLPVGFTYNQLITGTSKDEY